MSRPGPVAVDDLVDDADDGPAVPTVPSEVGRAGTSRSERGPGKAGRVVRSAGVVVLRPAGGGAPGRSGTDAGGPLEVLAVHRPRYDDWSLPKGKLERGEHPLVAAVREVVEETGVRPLPGRRLPTVRYVDGEGRPKTVQWWLGTVGRVEARDGDDEVDEQRWLPLEHAGLTLTQPMDVDLLAGVAGLLDRDAQSGRAGLDPETGPDRDGTPGLVPEPALVLLRHGSARSRRSWDGPELERPLEAEGLAQADRLVALLDALGAVRLVTSAAARCRQTVEPWLRASGTPSEVSPELTEQAGDDDPARPLAVLTAAAGARAGGPQVLCTHRPVLGGLLDAATGGTWRTGRAKPLRPAEIAVLTGPWGAMALDRHTP